MIRPGRAINSCLFAFLTLVWAVCVSAAPSVRFLVLSDVHGYDTDSLVASEATRERHMVFWEKERDDRFDRTRVLLDRAALRGDLDFILFPGDLTVDGEQASHKLLAGMVTGRREPAIPAFVVPGNHDVSNPFASGHGKLFTTPVPSIGPKEFSRLYDGMGYGAAFSWDTDSLSYAVEPVAGFVLIALDTVRWRDNKPFPFPRSVEEGQVQKTTLRWVEGILASARSAGATIVAMQHHPLGNFSELADLYRRWGVALVVAGHRHRFVPDLDGPVPSVIAASIASSSANALLIELDRSAEASVRIVLTQDPFGLGR